MLHTSRPYEFFSERSQVINSSFLTVNQETNMDNIFSSPRPLTVASGDLACVAGVWKGRGMEFQARKNLFLPFQTPATQATGDRAAFYNRAQPCVFVLLYAVAYFSLLCGRSIFFLLVVSSLTCTWFEIAANKNHTLVKKRREKCASELMTLADYVIPREKSQIISRRNSSVFWEDHGKVRTYQINSSLPSICGPFHLIATKCGGRFFS